MTSLWTFGLSLILGLECWAWSWACCNRVLEQRNIYRCFGPLSWACHLDLILGLGRTHLLFGLGGPNGFFVMDGLVRRLPLDLMSESLDLVPNWDNCGFGTELMVVA